MISIVIPTFNRPLELERCLYSLSNQSYSGEWEVIVVDDGGDRSLDNLVDLYINRNIRFLRQANTGPAGARNFGVGHAKGEYIVFLDDDCEPEFDWLERLTSNAQSKIMVGGNTCNIVYGNMFSEASQLLVSFLYDYFKGTPWYFFTSNNFMIDRKTFLELGGFSRDFRNAAGEDREFCARWLKKGFEMIYNEQAVVNHVHVLKLGSFWRQHYNYGKASFIYRRHLKVQGVGLAPINPLFYLELLLFPFRFRRHGFLKSIILSFTLFISQVATFTGVLYSQTIDGYSLSSGIDQCD